MSVGPVDEAGVGGGQGRGVAGHPLAGPRRPPVATATSRSGCPAHSRSSSAPPYPEAPTTPTFLGDPDILQVYAQLRMNMQVPANQQVQS